MNYPVQLFVPCEADGQLAAALYGESWAMLIGHRQSGKSTTVLAAKRLLKQRDPSINVYHITLADPIPDLAALWKRLHTRLHALNRRRFPMPQPDSLGRIVCTADTFLAMFTPDASASPSEAAAKTPAWLVIDEMSALAGMAGTASFLSNLRVCRDQRANGWLLRSVVLVGTPVVKDLVADLDPSRPAKRLYSPYTVVSVIFPPRTARELCSWWYIVVSAAWLSSCSHRDLELQPALGSKARLHSDSTPVCQWFLAGCLH